VTIAAVGAARAGSPEAYTEKTDEPPAHTEGKTVRTSLNLRFTRWCSGWCVNRKFTGRPVTCVDRTFTGSPPDLVNRKFIDAV